MGVNLIPKLDGFRIEKEDFKLKKDGGDGALILNVWGKVSIES